MAAALDRNVAPPTSQLRSNTGNLVTRYGSILVFLTKRMKNASLQGVFLAPGRFVVLGVTVMGKNNR
eukprot:193394-Hanusia_phi.AAC.1